MGSKTRSGIKESVLDLTKAVEVSSEEEEWVHPMFKQDKTVISEAAEIDEEERLREWSIGLKIEESPKMNRPLGLGRIQEEFSSSEDEDLKTEPKIEPKVEIKPEPKVEPKKTEPARPKLTPFTPFKKKNKVEPESSKIESK